MYRTCSVHRTYSMYRTRSMYHTCVMYRTCDICDGLVLFVSVLLSYLSIIYYIFVIITACNVPVFRYILVVFVSKNREKWNKKNLVTLPSA